MSKTTIKPKRTRKSFTVHVAAFEGRQGSGAFNWFLTPERADADFERNKTFIGNKKKPEADAFRFDVKVSVDPTDKRNEQRITTALENKFEKIGFEYDRLKLIGRYPKV